MTVILAVPMMLRVPENLLALAILLAVLMANAIGLRPELEDKRIAIRIKILDEIARLEAT